MVLYGRWPVEPAVFHGRYRYVDDLTVKPELETACKCMTSLRKLIWSLPQVVTQDGFDCVQVIECIGTNLKEDIVGRHGELVRVEHEALNEQREEIVRRHRIMLAPAMR